MAINNAVKELLSADPPVDAVLFESNMIALSSLKYINTLPLKVPQDLAIASFDQAAILDIFYPPVTYIRQPLEEIGQLAIESLLKNMQNPSLVTTVNVKAELIIQQSTKTLE